MLLVTDDDAAEHVAMAGQIFGGAVDHDVRAQIQRPKNHGRGKSAVHHKGGAGGLGKRSDLVDLSHAHQRVRDALHENTSRLFASDGPLHRLEIAHVHVRHIHAKGAEDLIEQFDRRAIDRTGAYDLVRAIHESRLKSELERGHSGSGRERAMAVIEHRGEFFERFVRRVR